MSKTILITNGQGIFKRWSADRQLPAHWFQSGIAAEKVEIPVIKDLRKPELIKSLRDLDYTVNNSMTVDFLRIMLEDHYRTARDKERAIQTQELADERAAAEKTGYEMLILELEALGIPFDGEAPIEDLRALIESAKEVE